MGSRYGGLKQLDPVGPSGETLLDYSVFDALRAGFNRVVFVIRRDFEQEFRVRVGGRYERQVDVDYVFQGLDEVPAGCGVAATRSKPLGTGHAIWCARKQVTAPFAAINADDFYGADAYRALVRFIAELDMKAAVPEFAMVAYRLGRTLTENGSVARGVCVADAEDYLKEIKECIGIEKTGSGAKLTSTDGAVTEFSGKEVVSMNFWGFTPVIFPMLEEGLKKFLTSLAGNEKAEYYIPVAVAEMIAARSARVKVLSSESSWFGVTYREDKPLVMESIARLIEAGDYPAQLGLSTASH